jgi:REP-associated tyrosine transposase
MARPGREEGAGAIHHVVPKGNGERRIVEDDRDRVEYTRRVARITRELGWLVHANCLMDTHHHAIVETSEPNLGVGMRRLLGAHSRWLNERHGRSGSVFAPHFWSRRIDDDGWLFRACLYVVLNPVAAGLCHHPREWPWCSYKATADGDPDAFAPGEERVLGMFGLRPFEARRCYAEVVDSAVRNIIDGRRLATGDLWRALREVRRPAVATVSDSKSDTGVCAGWCPT